MLSEIFYDRAAVIVYARKWALGRNPDYLDYENLGGDCTNFASQCVFAGCGVMNYKPVYGWYYRDGNDKTPSWTGVPYFYDFLISNKSAGPYGRPATIEELEAGDIVQLGNGRGVFYHTPVVIGRMGGEILVAAHTFDTFGKPLSSYRYAELRCLRIGAKKFL